MSEALDKARDALDSRWNKHIGGLFGMAWQITQAVENLAREIAREEIARASAGGGEMPPRHIPAEKDCPYCFGTGQPGGKLGGPELGKCQFCDGYGRVTLTETAPAPAAKETGGEDVRPWASTVKEVIVWCNARILAGKTASSYGADIECLRNFIMQQDEAHRASEARIAELTKQVGLREKAYIGMFDEASRLRTAAESARKAADEACQVGGGNPIVALAGIRAILTAALKDGPAEFIAENAKNSLPPEVAATEQGGG